MDPEHLFNNDLSFCLGCSIYALKYCSRRRQSKPCMLCSSEKITYSPKAICL